MTPQAWQTDDIGRIRLGGLHDAVVQEWHLTDASQHLALQLLGVHHQRTHIQFAQVLHLNIQSLWGGMIVGAIYAWPLHTLARGASLQQEATLQKVLRPICHPHQYQSTAENLCRQHPDHWLIDFDTAYGGDLGLICASVAIQQEIPCSKTP